MLNALMHHDPKSIGQCSVDMDIEAIMEEMMTMENVMHAEDDYHEKQMKMLYHGARDYQGGLPTLEVLVGEVLEYNHDKINEIISLVVSDEGRTSRYEFYEDALHMMDGREISKGWSWEDELYETMQMILYEYFQDNLNFTEMTIEMICRNMGLSYEESGTLRDQRGAVFLVNESQNVLFPDMHFSQLELHPAREPLEVLDYAWHLRVVSVERA